jgi:hypothetical protein
VHIEATRRSTATEEVMKPLNHHFSKVFFSFFHLGLAPAFGVALAGHFLLLPDEISEDTYFLIVMFVEVEAVAVAEANLEEIIVETLLGDAYLFGGFLERVLLCLPGLVAGS